MSVPDRIEKLTETFDYNLEAYRKGSYNETQVHREFIDLFFEELGWDITKKKKEVESAWEIVQQIPVDLRHTNIKSAFDVPGIETKATTKDILAAVRESRERSAEQIVEEGTT